MRELSDDTQLDTQAIARQRHDLALFVDQAASTIAAEYERIRRSARSDPGTAGDEGEGNWQGVLRGWLPPELAVVTKGRILGHKGDLSPQVDVLVLRPGYPPVLRDKHTYLAGGVLAAFECKLTLKRHHLAEAADTARAVRRLVPPRNGTPYGELNSPITFGVLAHSTSVRRNPIETIDTTLGELLHGDAHPREAIDFLCISDLAMWYSTSNVLVPQPGMDPAVWAGVQTATGVGPDGGVSTFYMRWHDSQKEIGEPPAPLYLFFERLLTRIAYEVEVYQPVADYWRQSAVGGALGKTGRNWPITTLTPQSVEGLKRGNGMRGPPWNEWHWY